MILRVLYVQQPTMMTTTTATHGEEQFVFKSIVRTKNKTPGRPPAPRPSPLCAWHLAARMESIDVTATTTVSLTKG